MRKSARLGVLLGVSTLMLGGFGGGAASAATPAAASANVVRPNMCPADYHYVFSSVVHKYKGMVGAVYGSKGETIGITLAKGKSVTKTITGSLSTEEGVIFAKAKETVSASLAKQITTTVTYSGSWKVTSAHGALHVGADEKSMKWSYVSYSGACKLIVHRKGTATFPYHVPTFWHTTA